MSVLIHQLGVELMLRNASNWPRPANSLWLAYARFRHHAAVAASRGGPGFKQCYDCHAWVWRSQRWMRVITHEMGDTNSRR